MTKGVEVARHVEGALTAQDYVLDLATEAMPISRAWLRSLHEVIVSGQDAFRVITSQGPQERQLPDWLVRRQVSLRRHRLPRGHRSADGACAARGPAGRLTRLGPGGCARDSQLAVPPTGLQSHRLAVVAQRQRLVRAAPRVGGNGR